MTFTWHMQLMEVRKGLYQVYVSRERDWENKKSTTLVFAGLKNVGTAVWGKKK